MVALHSINKNTEKRRTYIAIFSKDYKATSLKVAYRTKPSVCEIAKYFFTCSQCFKYKPRSTTYIKKNDNSIQPKV